MPLFIYFPELRMEKNEIATSSNLIADGLQPNSDGLQAFNLISRKQ